MNDKYSNKLPRLYEYRILYNAGSTHSLINNYHYFMAENAGQALSFHYSMLIKKKLKVQTISMDKKNPFNGKWEDRTDYIDAVSSPS